MADTDLEIGPIDYVVVEFPPGHDTFTGAMADELLSLVDAELIRVLDLLVLDKDADGNLEVFEFEDLDTAGPLAALEGDLAEVLAAEDLAHLAEAMEPGTKAGVLIWENSWAAPFAVAAREAGGQLIAHGRIPTQALIASFEADLAADTDTQED